MSLNLNDNQGSSSIRTHNVVCQSETLGIKLAWPCAANAQSWSQASIIILLFKIILRLVSFR